MNGLWVTECESSVLCWQIPGELIEVPEVSLDLYGGVEQNGEDGLGGTGVVDDLACEEEILVVDCKWLLFLYIFSPFKEKDVSVDFDLLFGKAIVPLETVDLLYLDSLSPHLLDQLGEDPRIGLDCAPLVEHLN